MNIFQRMVIAAGVGAALAVAVFWPPKILIGIDGARGDPRSCQYSNGNPFECEARAVIDAPALAARAGVILAAAGLFAWGLQSRKP